MNFFEQQLRTLTGRNTAFKSTSPVYVGRAAFLTLDEHIRARIEFVTTGTADKYEALQVTILNRTEGKVDTLLLRNQDHFASIRTPGGDMKTPHIWVYQGKPDWYGQPTDTDLKALSKAAHDYIALFAPTGF